MSSWKKQAMLVVGSVKDNDLRGARCELLRQGIIPKVVRMSADTFLGEFCDVMRAWDGESPEVLFRLLNRGDLLYIPAFRAITSSDGICAIVMHWNEWMDIVHERRILSGLSIWTTTPQGFTEHVMLR